MKDGKYKLSKWKLMDKKLYDPDVNDPTRAWLPRRNKRVAKKMRGSGAATKGYMFHDED